MSGAPIMVPLPDGQHALLRAPAAVPERLRRPLINARARLSTIMPQFAPGTPEAEMQQAFGRAISAEPERMDEINDLLMVALVSDWSFDMPVTIANLQELPGPSYDALKAECEKNRDGLFPDFTPNAKSDSPTDPSTGSEG